MTASGASAIRGIAAVAAALLLLANTSSSGKTEEGEKEEVQSKAEKEKAAKIKADHLERKDVLNPYGPPAPGGKAITKPEIKAVDTTGKERMDDAITCLARTIYWEARGTDKVEMHAVANVVMNRLGHEGFPNTICGVVKRGRGERACQFSWWCDGRPDSAQEKKTYAVAKDIARKALNRQLPDLTGGALYFFSNRATPDWAKTYVRTSSIGTFVFYKPSGEKVR